ncbi:MAG: prenyltransferase/squalene oxidase repeat-containing protein, partial [Pirellulales bacterium]
MIEVNVAGLPKGVTANAAAIPADATSGEIVLQATAELGDEELVAEAKVTVSVGGLEAVQPLKIHVKKVPRPAFGKAPVVVLQPGGRAEVNIPLQKNGFGDDLSLTVGGGRKDIKVKAVAEEKQVKLTVNAAEEVPDCTTTISLTTSAYGRKLSVSVPVEVVRFPFRVDSFRVVGMNPGATETVSLPVQRAKYGGPLEVAVENLPDGVAVAAAKVAAGQKEVALEFTVAADARPGVRSCQVIAKGEGMETTNALVMRVLAEDQEELPEGIIDSDAIKKIFNNDPAKSAPLRRRGSSGGRLTLASKQALMNFFGGTPESHDAVMKGLEWLASCQRPDGSWALDGSVGDGGDGAGGQAQGGPAPNPVGATALALLPFLSEGITHVRVPEGQEDELGQYQSVVERGLLFLGQQLNPTNGEFPGQMYAHSLATIVLCEAYGISADKRLQLPTQLAVSYLLNAQHVGGGWRYGPNQPGDMSVTGWVFLAIRSAQLTGVPISK